MKKIKNQDYEVHIRTDPKNQNYARVIRGFLTTCKKEEIHKRVATLEAFFRLKDMACNNYAIGIFEDNDFETTDEYSTLNSEDRKKVNKILPQMLKKKGEDLEKLVADYFVVQGWKHFIG